MKKIEYDWDIYTLRKKLGLSQKNLALILKVDITTIKNWEQHRRFPPKIGQLFLTILHRHPDLLEEYITEDMKNTCITKHSYRSDHGERTLKRVNLGAPGIVREIV